MANTINVTVWNEFRHERNDEKVKKVYPQGIHNAIKSYLDGVGCFDTKTATLDEPENGLTEDVLNNTDVLLWWGHMSHNEVKDEIVEKVYERVLNGMGLIVLHSGHYSKIFRKLMGTSCSLCWRENGDKERLWVVNPGHPIVEGIGEYIELPHEEVYGEVFEIPQPDDLVFVSWYEGGEVFRSGCCYNRGWGKVFYFQPGHETFPTYYNQQIMKVIENAIKWAAPVKRPVKRPVGAPHTKPLEEIRSRAD